MLEPGLMIVLGTIIGLVALAWLVLNMGPHFWTRRDGGGSEQAGVVVFVESIRWLGVPWGLRTVAHGLRQAGFSGRFLYWRWHATWRGCLVLPAIMDSEMLEREATRLSRFLERRKLCSPSQPVYIIGYSCGAYVALRALELLSGDIAVDGAAILAGAFSPQRDLSIAAQRVQGRLVVYSSLLDCCIAGLGTFVFGTADRKHTPSAGMVGTRRVSKYVLQIQWHPGMIRLGYWGGHFSASCAGFVRHCIAPALGMGIHRGGNNS